MAAQLPGPPQRHRLDRPETLASGAPQAFSRLPRSYLTRLSSRLALAACAGTPGCLRRAYGGTCALSRPFVQVC
jgi:hypothetical protein